MKQNQQNQLNLKIKLKIQDVLKYNLYVAYRSWFSRLIVLLGIGMCGYVVYQLTTTQERLDVFIAQHIVFIMLSVFILFSTPLKVWRITATQMQSPIFSGVSTYCFTPEAITIKVGDLEDTVQWSTYSRIVETTSDFRLFVDAVQAQILPKHNMTKEEINTLRQMIKAAHTSSNNKLKN